MGILSRGFSGSSTFPGLHAHSETYWALPRLMGSLIQTLVSFSADFYLEGDLELDAFVMLYPEGGPPAASMAGNTAR